MSAIERYNGPVHSPAAVNYDKWLLGTDIEGVTLSVVHVHSADAASSPPRDPEPRYKDIAAIKYLHMLLSSLINMFSSL